MNKKELKNFINQNGFFLHIDSLEKIENNSFQTEENKIKVPKGENIITFRGLASQNFAKGEVSRNGYKILSTAWDTKNFMKNPQILLSHNSDEPIGKAISIKKTDNGLEIEFFINLDWVKEDADKNRLRDGAFSSLSTGHITKEYKFENKESGEILSEKDAKEKYGVDRWDLFYGNSWNFVVTKAELIEVSMVTTPSNPDAMTEKNALENFKNNIMPKAKNTTEGAKEEDNSISTLENDSGSETSPEIPSAENAENRETKTEENSIEKNTPEKVEENSFDSEKNFLELKKTVEEQNGLIESQKNLLQMLGNAFIENTQKTNELEQKINSAPIFKGSMFKTQDNKGTGLAERLKNL